MGPGVVGIQRDAGFGDVLEQDAPDQGVVVGDAAVAAPVDVPVLRVQPGGAVSEVSRSALTRRAGHSVVHVAGADLVVAVNGVQVLTHGTRVRNAAQDRGGELVLESGAQLVGVGLLDVGIHGAQSDGRQDLGSAGPGERPSVVHGNGNGRQVHPGRQSQHRVSGRVLDDVEGHVAEVALVAHAPAGAQAGLAVAVDVPCDTNARSEVLAAREPTGRRPGSWNRSARSRRQSAA